jgi:hypothetical protein
MNKVQFAFVAELELIKLVNKDWTGDRSPNFEDVWIYIADYCTKKFGDRLDMTKFSLAFNLVNNVTQVSADNFYTFCVLHGFIPSDYDLGEDYSIFKGQVFQRIGASYSIGRV